MIVQMKRAEFAIYDESDKQALLGEGAFPKKFGKAPVIQSRVASRKSSGSYSWEDIAYFGSGFR